MGRGAPPLAHLVPAIRAALPAVPAPASLSPEEEGVRLYDAVTQLLLAAARAQPLVLILDDLHWADRASLGLLRHVARFLADARILALGTYRDVEVDQGHPLADLLPVLRHDTAYERIQLRGLSYAEASTCLDVVAAQDVADPLAHAIYTETSGNPFYMGEVFRHLLEEGRLVRRDGRWTADAGIAEWGIPEGVARWWAGGWRGSGRRPTAPLPSPPPSPPASTSASCRPCRAWMRTCCWIVSTRRWPPG